VTHARYLRDVPYTDCLERQAFAARRLDKVNRAVIQATWRGITGAGSTENLNRISEAVSDTLPRRHGIAFLTDEVVAAWALTVLSPEMSDGLSRSDSPFELRQRAARGWEIVSGLLEQGMDHVFQLGQDYSMAWPMIRGLVMADKPEQALRRMGQLAPLVGRMRQVLGGAKDSVACGMTPESLDGVEKGGDVQRLVLAELAMASNETMRKDLAQRILEQNADVQQVLSHVTSGAGPMVILRDQSGSMWGGPDTWCTACVIALATLAWADNRPVRLIDFSTATREWDLSVGRSDQLGKAVGSFLGGGTEIAPALRVAAKAVREWARQGVVGADVVLLSDGVDSAYSAMEKALDDMGAVRLFTVAINCSISGPLRTRATHYSEISASGADEVGGLAGVV
jgi:Mg-chelatase subunit ChlD